MFCEELARVVLDAHVDVVGDARRTPRLQHDECFVEVVGECRAEEQIGCDLAHLVRPVRGGEWVVLAHCIASFSGPVAGVVDEQATFARRLRHEHRWCLRSSRRIPVVGGTAARCGLGCRLQLRRLLDAEMRIEEGCNGVFEVSIPRVGRRIWCGITIGT